MESIKSAFNGKKSTIMYNRYLEADEILKEYGEVDNLGLDHILDPDEMGDESVASIHLHITITVSSQHS